MSDTQSTRVASAQQAQHSSREGVGQQVQSGRIQGVQQDLVYDVGAHRGEDTDFYLRLGFRVVAVEANPALAEHLRIRFAAELAAGRLQIVGKAIAERTGTVRFFVNKHLSIWGTSYPSWAERNRLRGADSEEVEVEADRFDNIVEAHGLPHYVKIDIEGADMLCVESLWAIPDRPTYVSIESCQTSWAELEREFEVLTNLGYSRFKVVNQLRHLPGVFRAKNGRPLHYSFEDGSSGPFGEYLDSPWLSYEQALACYRRIFVKYRLFGDNTPLQRTVGSLPVIRKLFRRVGWYDTHASM